MDGRIVAKERHTFRLWVVTVAVFGTALYGAMFHTPHLASVLPYLLLPAACLLMHLFMHRQHGGHSAHTPGERIVSSPPAETTGARVEGWQHRVDVRAGTRLAHVQLRIDGLSCAADAGELEHRLSHDGGVIDFVVNPITEIAYVTFDLAVTSPSLLQRRIENAGYSAMERSPTTPVSTAPVLHEQ